MYRLGVYIKAQGVPVDCDIQTGWGCTCGVGVWMRMGGGGVQEGQDVHTNWGCTCRLECMYCRYTTPLIKLPSVSVAHL